MTQLRSMTTPAGHRICVRLVVDGKTIWNQGVDVPAERGQPIDQGAFDRALRVLNQNTGPDVTNVTAADCLFDGEWRDHG